MEHLNGTQRGIMAFLDEREGATTAELVSHLSITKTAVRDQLEKLIAFGYVIDEDLRGLIGRPRNDIC